MRLCSRRNSPAWPLNGLRKNSALVATLSSRKRLRLIRQLQAAHDSLQLWEESLRTAALQSPTHGGEPSQTAVLLAIVDEAKQGVDRRLAELGVSPNQLSGVPSRRSVKVARPAGRAASSLRVCVSACRACGRALGAAFREAQAVADAASARILYGSIRDLEKQLWVLDPYQAF
jgi:hypothetical protein